MSESSCCRAPQPNRRARHLQPCLSLFDRHQSLSRMHLDASAGLRTSHSGQAGSATLPFFGRFQMLFSWTPRCPRALFQLPFRLTSRSVGPCVSSALECSPMSATASGAHAEDEAPRGRPIWTFRFEMRCRPQTGSACFRRSLSRQALSDSNNRRASDARMHVSKVRSDSLGPSEPHSVHQ